MSRCLSCFSMPSVLRPSVGCFTRFHADLCLSTQLAQICVGPPILRVFGPYWDGVVFALDRDRAVCVFSYDPNPAC